jgi:GNAT superfamily N-acetyltransferase
VVLIREIRDAAELAWANTRYRELRFHESEGGVVQLVAELDGAPVGLGRLVSHGPDVLELGGIWTAESARGAGVARAMVTALVERAGAARVWCLPFAHLADFYRGFGFADAPPPLPSVIAAKLADVAAAGLPLAIALVR